MRVVVRKAFFYILTAWAAISLNFLIPRIMPGDPADNLIEKFRGKLNPGAIKALRVLFGQGHETLWQQYLDYWHNMLTGNFGISFSHFPSPVSDVLGGAIAWTLVLISVCTILGFLIGTGLGMLAGWKRGSWLDALIPVTTFFSSIPYF